MRFLVLLLAAAAWAQQAPAPAPKLTGFPWQDESLRYMIRWQGGLTLGEATFTAHKNGDGWSFATTVDAGVPGFPIKDSYRSNATADLCSVEFNRSFSHGAKKTAEKTTFDQKNRRATRITTLPVSDGKTEIDTGACAHDAIAFVYLVRREMGQGRVAPAETVYFGSGYSVSLRYTGAVTLKSGIADHVEVSVKGPASSFDAAVDFARDPARTPLAISVPLKMGTLSVELVR